MKSKTTEYAIVTYLKEKFESVTSFDFSNISWAEILYMLGAIVGGFLTGMIIKKHGKSLLILLCLSGTLLAALTYFGITTMHFEKAKQIIGLPENASFYQAYELGLVYLKMHLLSAGALAFGFLIGYLFG